MQDARPSYDSYEAPEETGVSVCKSKESASFRVLCIPYAAFRNGA